MKIPDNLYCLCGHMAQDHHQSHYVGGFVGIDECEFYGFNESGGLDAEGEEHCMQFRAAIYVTEKGKVLTDEELQALADEAEKGYDVEHLKDH